MSIIESIFFGLCFGSLFRLLNELKKLKQRVEVLEKNEVDDE